MKKSAKLIIGIISVIAIICVAVVLVFAGNGKEKSEYDKRLTASQKYLDELNYEKAIAELELAIEIEPNNAEAYIALAEVYVEMGDYESAILVLEEAKEKVDDITRIEAFFESINAENENIIDENSEIEQQKVEYLYVRLFSSNHPHFPHSASMPALPCLRFLLNKILR